MGLIWSLLTCSVYEPVITRRTLVHVGGNAEHRSHPSSAVGGSSYIGDLGGLDDLRRATDERLLGPVPSSHMGNGAKSVTIHPDVTEFRYPGQFLVSLHSSATRRDA